MESFFKTICVVLVGVILYQLVSKRDKDIAILLSICVCIIATVTAAYFLEPIIDFIRQLQAAAELDDALLAVILKIVGIGILAEISENICQDSGNSAMAKTVQLLATCVILWLSLPLFSGLLSLLQKILGEL